MNETTYLLTRDYEELCAFCKSENVSPAPYFQAGKGNAYRTLEPEVFCHRCGKVAPPTLVKSMKD